MLQALDKRKAEDFTETIDIDDLEVGVLMNKIDATKANSG